jgi:hypothetical protein
MNLQVERIIWDARLKMDQDKLAEVFETSQPSIVQRQIIAAGDNRLPSSDIAMVVDLDGTLVATDLLHESFFASPAGQRPMLTTFADTRRD